VRRAIDRVGVSVSIATLVALLATLFFGRHIGRALLPVRTLAARGTRPVAAFFGARRALALAGLGVIVVAIGVLLWWRAKPPLPADSLFRSNAQLSLMLRDMACTRNGFASFKCGEETVEAEVRPGDFGAHVCMHAPFGPLTVRLDVAAPRFITGRYDPEKGSGGTITVQDGERLIGQFATRDQTQGQQFFQFDTRADHGKPLALKFKLEGAPLHCFDLALQP
jgi:hypothetical protein